MKHSILPAALGIVLVCMPLLGCASEISRSIRTPDASESRDDNFFEVGIGLVAYDGPRFLGEDERKMRLLPVVNGRYEWRGLFVENFAEDQNGVVIGYNAIDRDALSLDLILTSKHRGISRDNEVLRGIDSERDVVAGARLSGYAGRYLWQVQGWRDVSGKHGGAGASALVGRGWQIDNWNLHALAGAGYRNERVLDYYYGVTPERAAQTGLPVYRTSGSGLEYSAEIGATYPISERWVFRTTARYGALSSAVADSPLLDSNERNAVSLVTSFSYVF